MSRLKGISDWADVLATFPLFEGVGKARLLRLVVDATFAEFAPGKRIIDSLDYGDFLYVVLGGTVEAMSPPATRTLQTGDYFGELSLIDGRPRLATVVATSYVHVMKLPSRSVLKLAREHSTFTLAIFNDLVPRLRQFEARRAS